MHHGAIVAPKSLPLRGRWPSASEVGRGPAFAFFHSQHNERTKEGLQNLFGYLFAKAIEYSVNRARPGTARPKLAVSYSPGDAFEGRITSTFDEEKHQKLERMAKLGRQFYMDFAFFSGSEVDSGEEAHEKLTTALWAVPCIAERYSVQF